jgi:glycosyltransferase involved in cell wall biosynthesis
MIRIIYPVPELFPDNRARFIQIINTCHALAQKGLSVELITGLKKGCDKEKIFNFYGLKPCKNLNIVKLPIMRRERGKFLKISWNGIFNFSLLAYLLLKKKEKAVIFLRHLKLAKFLLRFRKMITNHIIFEVHEIFHLNDSLNLSQKAKLKKNEIEIYKKVDALICISNQLRDFLLKLINVQENRIFVIYDAFKKEWLEIKRNLDNSFICYTGSLYAWKGVDVLISAMKFLPNEKLLIVGGGDRLEKLKELAIKENVADRVKFIGSVSHELIPEYLSKAKVAVLPNISEGPSQFSSPLKLFEYMAAGIPIVASDLPVFREILQDNETAIFFEPGNPESLAYAIKKVLNSKELYDKLSMNAKIKAVNYTYENRANKIYKICRLLK